MAAINGAVALVKVNVDENPGISNAFRVQSIPAVYAIKDRQAVDSFIGALPEPAVADFVARLAPAETEADQLVKAGDEGSLRRALELQPDHRDAVLGLAELMVGKGETEEALGLLARIPEDAEVRRISALARLGGEQAVAAADGVEERLHALLDRVKDDEAARQEYIDVLELLGPNDPRTAQFRKQLTARLF